MLFGIINVPDQPKTQQICKKVVPKSPEMLQFIPNLYKTQKICKKAVDC